MISQTQKAEFEKRGLLKLEHFLPEAAVTAAREQVQRALTKAGVWADGAWTGENDPSREEETLLRRRLKPCAKSTAFGALITAELLEAAQELADGDPVRALVKNPQLLLTVPNAGEWFVPHKVWHLDVPRIGALGRPGVQMFTFLDRVERGGGGTLVVAGSHRMLNDQGVINSKVVKKRLRREPYFRDLLKGGQPNRQHFLDEVGQSGDVELQVVELHGEPGDVFLTDLRLLHTLAPNISGRPRLMVTQRFFRKGLLKAIAEGESERAAASEEAETSVGT